MFLLFSTVPDVSRQSQDLVLEHLIEKIKDGDRDAFSSLYEQVKTPVFSYALSITKNRESAADIMQDVFLKIYESAARYEAREKPMAWIFSITRNLCLDSFRKAQRESVSSRGEDELCEEAATGLSVEDEVILRLCLDTLQDDEREILILHAVWRLRHREIAQRLSLPIGTVLSKYNRTVKKLKAQLQGGQL